MDDLTSLWSRYEKYLTVCPSIGLSIDVSRMRFDDAFWDRMREPMLAAFQAMTELEKGAVANPDEKRMVGHYWLRAPDMAPSPDIRTAITAAVARVVQFASDVHQGVVRPEKTPRFENLLVVGIGGSALGPEFVASALGGGADRMRPYFFDNTDPDGMDRVIAAIGDGLAKTLTVVISKSGGTKETRNGMLEVKAAYERAGLSFAEHAVAVTGDDSELDRTAKRDGFITTFPMWDWVGGRTSELSAVGLLPAALQGIDVQAMLAGASDADAVTRQHVVSENPAALLALMWYFAGEGRGTKAMVVLPYKDRLELFSRYLQQLVMESIGKERDLSGRVVNQGLVVYGNKGSTDQHAYVQQLRDGTNDFFVTFIRVLSDRKGHSLEVEPGITSGDYLEGFLLGTRQALYENGRDSITLTLDEVSPRSVGALIAIYERAVGFYASLVGINAYHQPGVEAGKKAAQNIIALKGKVMKVLADAAGEAMDAREIATRAGVPA
ncbi:MAG TPA: glucose-6-phosphate isomerase, partial [Polyangiaceae bacterium]|nr:glucose-6-phosphate isomerase [Polyangiaceae bacterium]